ncbi:hypothetical protein ACP4OV_019161 [Aristida adscensionis]
MAPPSPPPAAAVAAKPQAPTTIRLLLSNWTTDRMAVYNPLTGALDLVPAPPEQKMRHNGGGKFIRMDSFLLYSDEAPASFRVVCCCHDKSRVRAAVFSSATKKWQVLPWSAPCPAQPAPNKYWLRGGTQVALRWMDLSTGRTTSTHTRWCWTPRRWNSRSSTCRGN